MLPSTVSIDYYNVSSGDTFISPANGWVSLKGAVSQNARSFISVTGDPSEQLNYSEINGHVSMIFPIIKGKTFRIWFNTSDITMKFIYSIGQKSIIKY
jgi:hypothetical protein